MRVAGEDKIKSKRDKIVVGLNQAPLHEEVLWE
jgi:hypothetical protein